MNVQTKKHNAMTTQFIVGQTYKINAVESITVTRRSDVSVWFSRNGKEFRRKVQISGYGNNQQEFINYEDRSLYAVKPQASVKEVETIKDWCEVHSETKANNLKESTITMGDFDGTTTLDNFVKYIKIGWAEGKSVINSGAKYASVESFLAALKLLESKHNHSIRIFVQIAPTDGQITAYSDFHWNFNFYIGGNTKHSNIMTTLADRATTLSNWF